MLEAAVHLYEGRQAVGGAGSVGDDLVAVLVVLLVDPADRKEVQKWGSKAHCNTTGRRPQQRMHNMEVDGGSDELCTFGAPHASEGVDGTDNAVGQVSPWQGQ